MNATCNAEISSGLPECSLLLPTELFQSLALKAEAVVAFQSRSWPGRSALCWASPDDSLQVAQVDRNSALFLGIPTQVDSLETVSIVPVHPVTLTHIVVSVPKHFYRQAKEQAEPLRDHLATSRKIWRQRADFYVKQMDLSARVAMCEPVLQGVFDKSKTILTILAAPEDQTSQPNGYHHDVDSDLSDLSIDESFLSAEILPADSSEDEAMDDLQSVASFTSASNGFSKGSSWHQAQARSLDKPVPPELCPSQAWKDSHFCVYTRTRHLLRLGMLNGDFILLRSAGDPESAHVGRLYAADSLFDGHSDVDLFVPPMLLFNTLGPLDSTQQILVQVKLLSRSESLSSFPNASSITLSRISTSLTSHKMYQNIFVKALQDYVWQQSGKMILRQGDVLAVPLDQAKARWSEDDSWIVPSDSTLAPTDIVYFVVSSLTLPKHARLATGIQGGRFGAMVQADATQIRQVGTKQARLPSFSLFPLPSFFGLVEDAPIMSQLSRSLTGYMNAALTRGTNYLDLILTFLLEGAVNSGKKTVIRQAAAASGLNVLQVDCFDLIGDSEVRTEANLKAKVERALECAPCVLLLGNVDALARKSQAVETGQDSRLVAALQNCVDELRDGWAASAWPVILAGTSAAVDKMPPGLLASFKTQFKLEAPNQAERYAILTTALSDDPLGPDVDLQAVATQTAALSAGDIVSLSQRARLLAEQRARTNQDNLKSVDLRGAMLPILQCDLVTALGAARSSYSESIGAPKIPNVTWDDVGGLATVKNDILDTIQLPLQHPELFAAGMKQRSGILLYGPPGTGKTLLAKAVATSCSLNFLSIKGPELLNMYIGESEANVRRIFQRAREAKPCCIFFDELDSVAPKRGNQGDSGGVMDRIVSQLLAELDGMAEGSGASDVFVIGATNRPDLLDPALLRPGRFDRMLYLGVSDTHEAQRNILQALTRKFRMHPDVDLGALAKQCPFNLTGADFYALCSDAMLKAMSRKAEEAEATINRLNSQPPRNLPGAVPLTPQYYLAEMATADEVQPLVSQQDFVAALRELEPSVSEGEMQHYKSVQQKFASSTLNADKGKGKGKAV